MAVDLIDLRSRALAASAELHQRTFGSTAGFRGVDRARADVLATADTFLTWLIGVVRIRLTAGPVVDQATGLPTGTTLGGIPVQIHDNEQFTLTADPQDSKGVDLADALTWTSSDESVVTLAVSDDTHTATVVAGMPGSAVVTVSDGTLTATEAVDVVPGGVATITVTEGPVEKQP
jgi:hypothetical protein